MIAAVLYGCETWSLTVTEGHRLNFLSNRVLRGIFWTQKDAGRGWKRLHHNLNASPYIVRVTKSKGMRWTGHVADMGLIRNANNFGRKT